MAVKENIYVDYLYKNVVYNMIIRIKWQQEQQLPKEYHRQVFSCGFRSLLSRRFADACRRS